MENEEARGREGTRQRMARCRGKARVGRAMRERKKRMRVRGKETEGQRGGSMEEEEWTEGDGGEEEGKGRSK